MPHRAVDWSLRIATAVALTGLATGCAATGPQTAARTRVVPQHPVESTLPDVSTVAPTAKTYVAVHVLNFREGPNHRFPAKTVLPAGTVVTPNGYVSGSWWQVDTPKFGTGWVDSAGLKPTG